MSEYDRKLSAAIAELEGTKMWPSMYMPPIFHAYRAIGLKVRPPHYANILRGAVEQGIFFALVWGLFMWAFEWRETDLPLDGMVLAVVFAGVLFGGAMAVAYAFGRRKWQLSAWEDL
ncbi:MAG: DUF6404 family protein [Sulfitobacter sp.]